MEPVTSLFTSRLPFVVAAIWRRIKFLPLSLKSPEKIFTKAYNENKWRSQDSRSGTGSSLDETAAVRDALPLLIEAFGCKSLLDIPCGDFYWMSRIKMDVQYTGGDIVTELIESNQEKYGCSNRRFIKLNLLTDTLPKSDLILCRDCLVHFSYTDIFHALRNIKSSGSTYLLTTTFIARNTNRNIITGAWRPLNLQIYPFNFPAPIQLIDEMSSEFDRAFCDKHLGLWKISDLPYLSRRFGQVVRPTRLLGRTPAQR